MRNLLELQHYRRIDWEIRAFRAVGDRGNGCFVVPFVAEPDVCVQEATMTAAVTELNCIASDGGGWDHVSVSVEGRCPTWAEMSHVYSLFALPHESWMQLHVPASEHVNFHNFCLHLWRPQRRGIQLPPSIMVGPKAVAR